MPKFFALTSEWKPSDLAVGESLTVQAEDSFLYKLKCVVKRKDATALTITVVDVFDDATGAELTGGDFLKFKGTDLQVDLESGAIGHER